MSDGCGTMRGRNRRLWTLALGLISSAALAAGHLPDRMEAIVQRGVGAPGVLKLEYLPVPAPGANQVLVHVYAAGVNPVDWKTRTGNPRAGGLADPMRPGAGGGTSGPARAAAPGSLAMAKIPGGEMAGVVAALGSQVTHWRIGEAVYGRANTGGYAQYVVIDAEAIAAKPPRLTFAQAAGLPVAGATAMLCLRTAGVGPGQTVVIIGAAGGVGSVMVQLAKSLGVHVIGIASSRHTAYLKTLGADEVVNYDIDNPAQKINGADAVIDLVDGPAAAALSYVRRGGKLILPTGYVSSEQCAAAGVTCAEPDRRGAPGAAEALAQLNQLVAAGKLTIKVEQEFALADASRAQEREHAGHVQGKIILITTTVANTS
jgi:NADPH:quinone reductase-like Zn-dependent oxidoreductase